MQATGRIIFNTVVLYAKIIICMGISLYTVPLVFHALGENDYGIYNLIAGIISMLAFMNGAMTISTQRYLSVTIGEKNPDKLLQVYNQSILLHILLGTVVVVIIEALTPFLFSFHILNIPPEQTDTARLLIHCMVASMFFTIITVPLDAVLNAYENMLVFSITGIIEAVLKLILAFSLPLFLTGRLPIYGFFIALIAVILFLIKYIYCYRKYKQLRINFKACRNRKLFGEISGFAGWNMLTTLAVVGRIQGLAVVLNHFLGTVANAAYGFAIQVNGVLSYFTGTIQKSINPQLMESEGTRDSYRQLELTIALTKYSMLILCIIVLPLLLELPYIFKLWLGDVPENSIEFTRAIIILALITQTSAGLMSVVQSSGKLKWYVISISTTLFCTLPIAYVLLAGGTAPVWALWTACITEIVAVALRLYFAHRLKAIPVLLYLKKAVLPNLMLMLIIGIILWGFIQLMEVSLTRVILVVLLDVVLYLLLSWHLIFTSSEQTYLKTAIKKII